MKKYNILFLLLFFFSTMSGLLVAEEEGTLTVKVNPFAEGKGRIYLSGEEVRKGESLGTEGDGKLAAEADYNGIAGAKVEIKGSVKGHNGTNSTLGFGDNIYAYAHLLAPFGIDRKVFDAYLQSGRFELNFDNAKEAGDDSWLADVDPLKRDFKDANDKTVGKANMQLDLKILDMLTIRYGVSFAPIDSKANDLDMGWSLLFSKAFGDHKIESSLAYVANLTSNKGRFPNGKLKPGLTKFSGFDQFGFSLAYIGKFGNIHLTPFANLAIKGLFHKPDYFSYENPFIFWSSGIKFQLRDAANSYDLFGAGFDIGGAVAENFDHKGADGKIVKEKYIHNAALGGFSLKIWSDGLRAVMGKNYLSVWSKIRFRVNDPIDSTINGDVERKSVFNYFGIGLEQRLVNKSNADVKLKLGLEIENIAPFYLKDFGYLGSLKDDSDGKYKASDEKHVSTKVFIDLGLAASFTSVFTAKVK